MTWQAKPAIAALATILLAISLLFGSPPGRANDEAERLAQAIQETEVDRAIAKAIAWLATQQDAEGHFAGRLSNTYTALACLAMMAAGEQDGRSPHGEQLRRGLLYLAGQVQADNPYLGRDGGRMYGHAICTLALCEAYGMLATPADNRTLGEAIHAALKIIFQAQVATPGNHRGGWRYEPTSQDADLSVTAWQMLALRAARNCGFEVPQSVVDDALAYVRLTHGPNGFAYQPGSQPTPAMQAAGIVILKTFAADQAEADRARLDAAALHLPRVDLAAGNHFYYQSYYLATAANMLGDLQRDALLPKLETVLLGLQQPDGQFAKHSGHDGGVYATAFATIILAVRHQYLPIYQE